MTTTDSRPARTVPMPRCDTPDATSSQPATVGPMPMAAALAVSNSRPAMAAPPPDVVSPDAISTPPTAAVSTPNLHASGVHNSRPARVTAASILDPPGGPDSPAATVQATTDECPPQGLNSPATDLVAEPKALPSRGTKTAGRQPGSDAQDTLVAGADAGRAAEVVAVPRHRSLLDPALCLAADIVDDLERVRIANENRIRQLTRDVEDKDGEERGFGLTPDHPDVLSIALIVHALQQQEHQAVLGLQRKMRKHPLYPWVKANRGVGEKQAARLLAAIGDPYINSAKGQPRTVSALWAYCGLHVLPAGLSRSDDHGTAAGRNQLPADQWISDDQESSVGGVQHGDPHHDLDTQMTHGVAAKRRKGERANWSTKAKMRAYLIAESCVKQLGLDCRDGHCGIDNQNGSAVPATDADRVDRTTPDDQRRPVAAVCSCSPYRVAYDQRRAHTAVTHPDWTDGHSHNDALRVASKAILRDLWRAAREWHMKTNGGG